MERGHRQHARVAAHHALQRVGYHRCLFERRARRQVYLYGKLVALGNGHELLRDAAHQQDAQQHTADAQSKRGLRVTETPANDLIVRPLQKVEHRRCGVLFPRQPSCLHLYVLAMLLLAWFQRVLDERVLQVGHQQFCHQQRREQYDADGPRERLQEVERHSRHGEQDGEERHRDGQRGREDAAEEVSGTVNAGLPPQTVVFLSRQVLRQQSQFL